MFLYVVKNKRLHFLFSILVLILASTLEDVLPRIFGVGFPILLMVTLSFAVKKPMTLAVIFAVAAGASEDAISSLPMMTSVSFFVVMALLTRWAKAPILMSILGCALYQFWIMVWLVNIGGNVFVRSLAAIPISGLTILLILPILRLVEKGVALNEEG